MSEQEAENRADKSLVSAVVNIPKEIISSRSIIKGFKETFNKLNREDWRQEQMDKIRFEDLEKERREDMQRLEVENLVRRRKK